MPLFFKNWLSLSKFGIELLSGLGRIWCFSPDAGYPAFSYRITGYSAQPLFLLLKKSTKPTLVWKSWTCTDMALLQQVEYRHLVQHR